MKKKKVAEKIINNVVAQLKKLPLFSCINCFFFVIIELGDS